MTTGLISDAFDIRSYTALTDRVLGALGQQMTDMRSEISRRLDQIADDGKDVGERLARIEAMQVGNATELKDLKEETKSVQTEVRTANERTNKLENRVVRLETLIVPAASLIAAAASSLVGHFVR